MPGKLREWATHRYYSTMLLFMPRATRSLARILAVALLIVALCRIGDGLRTLIGYGAMVTAFIAFAQLVHWYIVLTRQKFDGQLKGVVVARTDTAAGLTGRTPEQYTLEVQVIVSGWLSSDFMVPTDAQTLRDNPPGTIFTNSDNPPW